MNEEVVGERDVMDPVGKEGGKVVGIPGAGGGNYIGVFGDWERTPRGLTSQATAAEIAREARVDLRMAYDQ